MVQVYGHLFLLLLELQGLLELSYFLEILLQLVLETAHSEAHEGLAELFEEVRLLVDGGFFPHLDYAGLVDRDAHVLDEHVVAMETQTVEVLFLLVEVEMLLGVLASVKVENLGKSQLLFLVLGRGGCQLGGLRFSFFGSHSESCHFAEESLVLVEPGDVEVNRDGPSDCLLELARILGISKCQVDGPPYQKSQVLWHVDRFNHLLCTGKLEVSDLQSHSSSSKYCWKALKL